MWALLEKSFELEKLDRSFTLLPSDFVGTLIDKFLNGSLGDKSWLHHNSLDGQVHEQGT